MTILRLVIAGMSLVLLAACGGGPASSPDTGQGRWSVDHVNVDGRMIICVAWKDGYGGGVDCDWD